MNKRVVSIVSVAVAGLAYLIGYSSSPGPYIPSEDSFDYRHHRCVPLNSEEQK